MAYNISEIDFENVGSWPLPIRIFVTGAVFVAVLAVGIWLDTKSQIERLGRLEKREIELRKSFEKKWHQAANLNDYKTQLNEMRESFGTMLRQLPSKTEVPGLLEDISATGVASGLEFKLFDPQQEVQHDFYAELPIRIAVVGHYHQFGDFVSQVAALNRIVTLHDFQINHLLVKTGAKIDPRASLMMEVTAKTYRYLDEDEVNDEGQDERENKK